MSFIEKVKQIVTAPDKIAHAKGSVMILIGSVVVLLACYILKINPIAGAIFLAGLSGAVSVEFAQKSVNDNVPEGQPKPHEVSLFDAAASMVATTIAALIIQGLDMLGQLPPALMLRWPTV